MKKHYDLCYKIKMLLLRGMHIIEFYWFNLAQKNNSKDHASTL